MTVTVSDVVNYMGTADAARWKVMVGDDATYPEIADALQAETYAQAEVVEYPLHPDTGLPWSPPNLDQALKRRVVRNLAMRALTLGAAPGNLDTGATSVRPALLDAEVRRFERSYPRLVSG